MAVAAWALPRAAQGATVVPLQEVGAALSRAAAGDTICISDGDYQDLELKWRAPGVPVCVSALHPGKVILSGKSSLKIAGDSLTVSSIDFVKAHPAKGNVVEFRIGKELANACRLTDCLFDGCNPARRDIVSSYIVLHGKGNRVDHCSLTGKLSLGVTLLVNLNDARSLDNGHRIDHNYFGHRPVYGSNGAETMRIGTSQQAYETSATVVEDNYFESCDGEVEIISVKSSGNVVRGNFFDRCQGVVALRHGKGNTVEGNTFCGMLGSNTGGVRIVDSGHIVKGNTFCQLQGTRFFSALAIMNSVPNSLPNRYVRVSDVAVTDNLFVDCSNIEFGTGCDAERTEAPEKCVFARNVIMSTAADPFTIVDEAAGVEFVDNVIEPVKAGVIAEISARREAARAQCGTLRHTAQSALEWETIKLEEGVVYRTEPFVISRPTVIKGNSTELRWTGSSAGNFITIADGGSLQVSGVTFNGALQQGHTVVHNAIATAPAMLEPYSLSVRDCSFINMPESGCCAIRGTKGTFAGEITVTGCSFADLSGNAISLADETDDKGRYSAEHIIISDCTFSHMLGIPINIYRGGSDESTSGPCVTISGCTFTDCCNRQRGSVLRLIGPQKLEVENCTFTLSGQGGYSIRLDETSWEDITVKDCVFNNSGRILSNRNVEQ